MRRRNIQEPFISVSAVFLFTAMMLLSYQTIWAQESETPPADEFIGLGTSQGIGGRDFMRFDRSQIKHQIKQFIPPLLQPAFVGHAFVLPPNAFRVAVSTRFTSLRGEDFFRNGDSNTAEFKGFAVDRKFIDLDLFYGFDLNRKYLHGFTLGVNIPYLDTQTNGWVHPNGQSFIDVMNNGSSQEVGDIGVFIKKKVVDQGNFKPFGFAVAGAAFLPTGKNDARFGNNGHILERRPDPDNDGVQASFQQIIESRGGPEHFFTNLAEVTGNEAWRVPAGMVENAPRILTPFAFNNGIFGRFSGDGRMPSVLQPGTGAFSYLLGAFVTRQFEPGDFAPLGRFPGRGALHLGILHQFRSTVTEQAVGADGMTRTIGPIDPGDLTTYFGSFVKPVYKDFLTLDLTYVAFRQQEDRYAGKIPEPEIVVDKATGERFFEFALVDRPSFSKGTTGLFSPSLIYSPDPQVRITLSPLFRVVEPESGPAPSFVLRLGTEFTF